MCRSSESDLVQSQRRVQDSSRESCTCMAVTLAQRSGQDVRPGHDVPRPEQDVPPGQDVSLPATLGGSRLRATPPGSKPMEKFIIEGGVPLSGTIVPAANKNGALPILAACLLTDDEVVLRNVPRISDVEAMVQLLG